MRSTSDILGIRFAISTKEQIQSTLCRALHESKCVTVFTPNPEFALAARRDSTLCDMINSADILLPDGIGIIIASRILNVPLPERIAGIDIGEFLLSQSDKKELRIFLLGGREGVAERARDRISERYPHTAVCGAHHGYFKKSGEECDRVIDEIDKAAPDILFVCFGFPEQERWILANRDRLPTVKIFAGLGGSIDVWAEDLRRAPVIFQKLGLEWLWRVARQPSRWRIFLDIPTFFVCVLKQKIAQKTHLKGTSGEKSEFL